MVLRVHGDLVAVPHHPPIGMDPWLGFLVGSVLCTVLIFVPSFTLVFMGAPFVEQLRGNHALSAALTGIAAAVVGVITNLAVVFSLAPPATSRAPDDGALQPLGMNWPSLGAIRKGTTPIQSCVEPPR